MTIQKVTASTLGAMRKTKAYQLKQQQKLDAKLRLDKKYKETARSLLPDIRYIPKVNEALSDNSSIIEQVQKYRGELEYRDSVWAPWIKA